MEWYRLGRYAFSYQLRFWGIGKWISKVLLVGVAMLAAVLLFTPYEAVLEGVIAILFVAAVVLGFLLHPRKEVFYLRTTVRLSDADGNWALALVQKSYWELPWWDQKIVFLTLFVRGGSGFERGGDVPRRWKPLDSSTDTVSTHL
jgi:hypothetical protein